ncbi:MAG: FliM/FliN family flagellar motor switch protein [Pseudomonadota bacterium]
MSTDEVLTESEIEALMDSVGDDEERSGSFDDGQYRRFDFAAKEHALLREFTLLQALCERKAELLETVIERTFALEFEIQAQPVTLLTNRDQLAALDVGCAFTQATLPPLSHGALCVSPCSLLSFVLNAYFGGDLSMWSPNQDAAPRPSELQIASRLAEKVFRCLEATWQDRLSVQAQDIETLGDPDWLAALPSDQQLLRIGFDLQLIDFTSSITVLLPFESLAPYQAKFSPPKSQRDASGTASWEPSLKAGLPAIELEIALILDEHAIALEQLLLLKPGAVLPIGSPDRVVLRADSVDLATGSYGALDAKKAVQLSRLGAMEAVQ